MGRIIFIGGGARSGKSRFALRRAAQLGQQRLFVATATAGDEDMRERIARHQRERGETFVTREEPIELVRALDDSAGFDVVVVDCLTMWLSNLLLQELGDAVIERRVGGLVETLADCPADVVLVSNEVGLGVHPEHALGRRFRDLAGRAHQRLAAVADEIYLGAMGCMIRLKPAPISIVGDP